MSARVVSGIAVFAFAIVTAKVGLDAGAPLRFLLLETLLGLTFLVAGKLAWRRRPDVRTGPALTLCAALWFLGSYGPSGIAGLSMIGFSFERYYDVVLAYLVLTFPDRRLNQLSRLVLAALAANMILRSLARLLIYDPPAFDPVGCSECAPNPFAVLSPDAALLESVEAVTGILIVTAYLVVVGLVILRWRGAAAPSRRILRPVLLAGGAAAWAAAYQNANLVSGLIFDRPLVAFEELWIEIEAWLLFGARALIPLGFLAGVFLLRAAHGPAARLAVEFGTDRDRPEHIESALRQALADPSIEVRHWDAEQDRWTDAQGRQVSPPEETDVRAVLLLERHGTPVAAVVHDAVLLEDPGLLASVGAVLRLSIDNDRLSAQVRRQLEEVHASRARILAAADEERRGIERDLHDGAQHRLLGISMSLQDVRSQAASIGAPEVLLDRLELVAVELREAMREMRELARGIHPAVLTNEGLEPAVRTLARRCTVPVELGIDLNGRLPAPVETAAYYVVAEGLTNVARHSHATRSRVQLGLENGSLVVEVSDDGSGGASPVNGSGLRGLSDRVAALDGVLTVTSRRSGGTCLRAEIPRP
ncbi:MAG: sensor histidine kinase [Geodermatophilaceae bacterium]|nr:sensor histidine kinase [Geodermatophilaceae bacterium]